ncbi:glycosyltransferase [Burkholderia stabilis]|uniref:glycosyltransferase n=1 Tax=Burkholderia stabilis TaxID=95485 RepID=UPI00080BF48F|nr:glycosyltransferase [Burkholderia stabilis]GAU03427.1 glycosyl transferase [Burkholderia stabilis]
MRIVQIVESSATGTLSIVRLISNRFASLGHDVHVIYSRRPETPAALHALFDARVVLHCVKMTRIRDLPSIVTLRRMLVRLQPDVVHLHSSRAGFLGRLAAVRTLRATRFFYSPHCIAFMRRDLSAAARYLFVVLERIASIRQCLYIACSASEVHAIRSRLTQPVELVENAIDHRTTAPGRYAATGRCEIVTVGGIRAQKNPRLFAEIARRMRDSRVHFKWIGDGDERARLELAAAGVQITGWLAPDAVAMQLASADIYLSTSSWEGMPISVIEAMACGLPVVATRCAGNVDVVDPPCIGVLFDNADEAVATLGRLAGDPTACATIGAAARSAARRRFDDARFVRQLDALYRVRTASTCSDESESA